MSLTEKQKAAIISIGSHLTVIVVFFIGFCSGKGNLSLLESILFFVIALIVFKGTVIVLHEARQVK